MPKNTIGRESRGLSFFVRSRVGEICFLLCMVMSIAMVSYFSNMSIAEQTGMELVKLSQGVMWFYAAGSFLVCGGLMVLYVLVYWE